MAELGVVFVHPEVAESPRVTRGGAGGSLPLALPQENERVTVVLGRPGDDAATAVALWTVLAERIGLDRVVIRTASAAPAGWHPTRTAQLVDATSGAVLGLVGEADSEVLALLAPAAGRRAGLLDVDFDALVDPGRATRRSEAVLVPSRFPSAGVDLAFVTPREVGASDVARALRAASELVESAELFDVYSGASLPAGTRSLAFRVSFSPRDATLTDEEIADNRRRLIDAAGALGATLR
jgi:phenylalanyl-tRNA synthetase beta chain